MGWTGWVLRIAVGYMAVGIVGAVWLWIAIRNAPIVDDEQAARWEMWEDIERLERGSRRDGRRGGG